MRERRSPHPSILVLYLPAGNKMCQKRRGRKSFFFKIRSDTASWTPTSTLDSFLRLIDRLIKRMMLLEGKEKKGTEKAMMRQASSDVFSFSFSFLLFLYFTFFFFPFPPFLPSPSRGDNKGEEEGRMKSGGRRREYGFHCFFLFFGFGRGRDDAWLTG